jgi:PhnB protein
MVQSIPEGVSSVVPYLCIRGAMKAIEFYKTAFGAEVMSMMPMGPDLVGHADLKIAGSRVYLADEAPEFSATKSPKTLKGSSANLHVWVEDCDAVFGRAVAAGCKVVMPLTDQFWGDRYGILSDPFGHVWAITTHKEDVSPEEMQRRSAEFMASQPPPAPKPRPKTKKKGLPKKAEAKPSAKAAAKPAAPSAKAPTVEKAKKSKKSKKDKKAKKAKAGKKSKKDKKRKKKSKR